MRAGPAPKSAALLAVTGGTGHVARKKSARRPLTSGSGEMAPPRMLDAGAVAIWHLRLPPLRSIGTVTALDTELFAAWCQSYSLWEQLSALLALETAEGRLLIVTPTGFMRVNPLVAAVEKARDAVVRLAAELGMTADGRAKLEVGGTASALSLPPARTAEERKHEQEQKAIAERFFGDD